VRVFATNVSGAEYSPDATFTTTEQPHQVCETAECLGSGGSGGGGGGGSSNTGGGNTGGGGSMPGPIEGPPAVTVAGTSTSVSSAGAFALKVGCPAGESSCSGTVTIKTVGAVAASAGHEAKKKKALVLTLATGSFTVSGGQVKTLSLHLSSQGRALLAHSHVLHVKATITAHNPGGKSATTTLTLTLRLAAKKSKK
jgi:hypothetical protein